MSWSARDAGGRSRVRLATRAFVHTKIRTDGRVQAAVATSQISFIEARELLVASRR